MSFWGYPKYETVAEKKEKAAKKIAFLHKKGQKVNPVVIEDRTIVKTFWGKAWCENLESYRDYDNRLGRGRSCLRSGSVLDLAIEKGKIKALVQGSKLYKISVTIAEISGKKWQNLKNECSGKIDSLIELLQGKFSQAIMSHITNKDNGLFPEPDEIEFDCSCPDYAAMCKHVAAVLYGVGVRLDHSPESFFILRHVNHIDLINTKDSVGELTKGKGKAKKLEIDTDLSDLFGIQLEGKLDVKKIARVIKNPVLKKTVTTVAKKAPKKKLKKVL